MKKVSFSVLLQVLFCFTALAQWGPQRGGADGDRTKIKEMLKRQLVVEVHEEDPRLLKKYAKKPEKLEQYKNDIKIINEQTALAINGFWKMGEHKPVYQPKSVIKQWTKQNNKEYAILSFQSFTPEHTFHDTYSPDQGISRQQHAFLSSSRGYVNGKKRVYYAEARLFSVRLSNEEEFFSFVIMSSYSPQLGEMVFAVQLLQEHFQNQLNGVSRPDHIKQLEANPQFPANKILLLDEQIIDKKLTEAEIKNAFPFPYEIVPYDKIEEAILNRDSRYAYVQFIPKYAPDMTAVVHCLADAENGKLLGFSNPTIIIPGRPIVNNEVNARELKKYAAFVRR